MGFVDGVMSFGTFWVVLLGVWVFGEIFNRLVLKNGEGDING